MNVRTGEKALHKQQEQAAADEGVSAAAAPGLASGPLFARAAIVGVGMMGGSLGLALRARQIAQMVVGVDTNVEGLARAQEIGAIDEGTTDLAKGVAGADVVILAAPVGVIPGLLQRLAPLAAPDALITDIGSAKRRIVTVGEEYLGARFVGGHPMAGSPQGGIDAALPDLFGGAAWGVVRSAPPDEASDLFVRRAADMARSLGARPVLLDSLTHDRAVALVSHLPHVLSFAFADTVANSADPALAARIAGSSYADMLRVSTSSRAFWHDIFLTNRAALLQTLAAYEACLRDLRQTIEALPPQAE